jgi:hypothetical protein
MQTADMLAVWFLIAVPVAAEMYARICSSLTDPVSLRYRSQFEAILGDAMGTDEGLGRLDESFAFTDGMSWGGYGLANGFGSEIARARSNGVFRRQVTSYCDKILQCQLAYAAATTWSDRVKLTCELHQLWRRARQDSEQVFGLLHALQETSDVWSYENILEQLQVAVRELAAAMAQQSLEDESAFWGLVYLRVQMRPRHERLAITLPDDVARFDFGDANLDWEFPPNWLELVEKYVKTPDAWMLGLHGPVKPLKFIGETIELLINGSWFDAKVCQAWLECSEMLRSQVPADMRTAVHYFAHTGIRPDPMKLFGIS